MKKIYNEVRCDICKKTQRYIEKKKVLTGSEKIWVDENGEEIKGWQCINNLPVKFLTEQNEGTSTKPYIDYILADICPDCWQKFIDNYPIVAYGAQGYNTIEFDEKIVFAEQPEEN